MQFLLPAVVAHFNLLSKRRATHISTLPPNLTPHAPSQVPSNLPDSRTAQRLLDIISQLEQGVRTTRHTSGAATTELENRLANLQFENQRLRSTRQQAAQRLGSLITQLHQQLETSTPQSTMSTALAGLTQDLTV